MHLLEISTKIREKRRTRGINVRNMLRSQPKWSQSRGNSEAGRCRYHTFPQRM